MTWLDKTIFITGTIGVVVVAVYSSLHSSQRFENEKIISQIVGGKSFGKNGDKSAIFLL